MLFYVLITPIIGVHVLGKHSIDEVHMLQTAWFDITLLFLVSITLLVCVAALFYIIRLTRSDKATSGQVIEIMAKMSDQQVYVTERHERMTEILATVSNEFLRMRQNEKRPCPGEDGTIA